MNDLKYISKTGVIPYFVALEVATFFLVSVIVEALQEKVLHEPSSHSSRMSITLCGTNFDHKNWYV